MSPEAEGNLARITAGLLILPQARITAGLLYPLGSSPNIALALSPLEC